MKRRNLGFLALGLVVLAGGCTGPAGPMGPAGPAGSPGVSLTKEYTGTISANGDFSVDVPEILNKRSTTFVEVYYAIPSAPNIWTPLSDGWKDDPTISHTCSVSWTFAKVYLFGMETGDLYLIKVFTNN